MSIHAYIHAYIWEVAPRNKIMRKKIDAYIHTYRQTHLRICPSFHLSSLHADF